ncbi:hypothetical protein, partial [Enterococcus faecalis]|uniref:hypothetical protein n=1 Tax=Enterococcus faecalis TaxID=1351 RepID=UPI0022EFF8BD
SANELPLSRIQLRGRVVSVTSLSRLRRAPFVVGALGRLDRQEESTKKIAEAKEKHKNLQ